MIMPKLPRELKKINLKSKTLEQYKNRKINKETIIKKSNEYKNSNFVSFVNKNPNLTISQLIKNIPYKIHQKTKQNALKIKNTKLKDLNINQLKILQEILEPITSSKEKRNAQKILEQNRTKRKLILEAIKYKKYLKQQVRKIRLSENAIYLAKVIDYCKLHIKNSKNIKLKDIPLEGKIINEYKKLFGDLTIKEINDIFKLENNRSLIKGHLRNLKENLGIQSKI
jgi:hypothetical protein